MLGVIGFYRLCASNADAEVGGCGDGVLRTESESAVSSDDGDDGAAVSCGADLAVLLTMECVAAIRAGRDAVVARRLVAIGWLILAAVYTRYDGWILGATVWCVLTWRSCAGEICGDVLCHRLS